MDLHCKVKARTVRGSTLQDQNKFRACVATEQGQNKVSQSIYAATEQGQNRVSQRFYAARSNQSKDLRCNRTRPKQGQPKDLHYNGTRSKLGQPEDLRWDIQNKVNKTCRCDLCIVFGELKG